MSISNSFSSAETPLQNLEFQKHAVEFLSSLPREVEEVTNNTEIYDGVLSWSTEYAAVVTQTQCFVWNYSDYKQSSERDIPVYKFKMPICDEDFLDDLSNHYKLPLVCIVPSNQIQRPGLLVCSRKGEFRYWEDVTQDNIFEENYSSLKVYLQEDDFVTHLACHETHQSSQDTCIIIFGSAQSALYRVNISKMGVNSMLNFSSLSRAVGIMENFSSYLWLNNKYDTGDVTTTTLGNKLENNLLSEVFVLMDKSLEKWTFGHTRSVNKYVQGQDIRDNIIQEIYENDTRIKKTDQMDLRLLDMEFARNGKLVILASYSFGSNQNEIVENKNLSYTLVILGTEEIQYSNAVIYKVDSVFGLKNQNNLSLGPQANLVMPNGGPAVFVVFPQAIMITTILKGANYSNIVSMHDPVGDRIIGFCGEGSKSWHNRNVDQISRINILSARTGIMTCKLNIGLIMDETSHTPTFDDQMNLENSQEMRNRELKTTLEQAILNTSEKVPVTNYVPCGHGGDINAAAIEISDEIMNSRSQYLFDFIELKSQLNERYNKMTLLIQTIKNSGMADDLHLSTRQHLFWNAEKVACALKLWENYNASLSSKGKAELPRRKLFVDAIQEYLQENKIKIKPNEDIARFFFRFHVRDISSILIYIVRNINERFVQEDNDILISEVNKIIWLSFEAAFKFRIINKDLYAITSNRLKESWTFHPELLKVLYQQFEMTVDIIKNSDDQSDGERIELLKDQLVGLADILLRTTSERLSCDDSVIKESAEKYHEEWATILKHLVKVGKSDDAFSLSETYGEYKILVDLIMYHGQNYGQNIDIFIKKYVKKYQKDFEYPLYEWYIENKLYADLLSQPHTYEYRDSLQKFLNDRNLKDISWIHDIYLDRYGDASIKLRHLARNQLRVDRNKNFLSLSKLTFLAELGDDVDIKNEDVQRNLEEIELGFELLNAYYDLQHQFVTFVISQEPYCNTESEQVNVIMEGTASSWKNYKPALAQMYEKQVAKILRGEIIPTSEMVEVLTLKDKKMKDDFLFALQFTLNDIKLSDDHRRTILQTIWRRIYINDNWEILLDTSNMSDEELNDHIRSTFVFNALNTVRYSADIPLNQWFYPPVEAFFSNTIEQFRKWFPLLGEEQKKGLIEDYIKENDILSQFIEKYNLSTCVEYALGLLDRDRDRRSKFE